jgi:uncharacterized protein with PIN domain
MNTLSEKIVNKIEELKQCHYCGSTFILFHHRSWWQKLLHPNQKLCQCHDCGKKFWMDKPH